MDDKRSGWTPDKDAALKALIRQTVNALGDLDPDQIPHLVKQRLEGRATGDVDVETYAREVLKEIKRSG